MVHMPRHLQDVHGWTKEHARTALQRFGLRKAYTYSDPSKVPKTKKKTSTQDETEKKEGTKIKDYHHYRYCPVVGCASLVKRLPPHLKNVHGLVPASDEYKQVMSQVRGPVKDCNRRPYHERPRFSGLLKESGFSCSDVVVVDHMEEEKDDNESVDQSPDSNVPLDYIAKFEAWIHSADGGKLDKKTSQQHAKQVRKLLAVIDDKQDLSSLFNHGLINDKFLEAHSKEHYHPKTMQSYLTSLRHFYSFALSESTGLIIPKERVIALQDKVTCWSSSFRVECSKRLWEKMEEDLNAQITQFERSKASRDAICLLGQLSGAHNVIISQAQYTLIRDFLLVEISIDNANRAGALAKMTLGELRRMTKENDDFLVLVKDHKTLSTHGPARIVLSPKLKSWVNIFVQEVRSQVVGADDKPNQPVFMSFNGEAVVSSQINKAIKSIWKKAGLDGSPSSTLLRKSVVSSIHSLNDSSEARGNLADLMGHNLSTASKYYRLHEKSKSSVLASKQLRQVMRKDPAESPSLSTADDGEASKTSEDKQVQQEMPRDGDNDCASLSNPEEGGMSRASWNKEKEALIRDLFKEDIDKQTVTMDIVRCKTVANEKLMGRTPKKYWIKYGRSGVLHHLDHQSL